MNIFKLLAGIPFHRSRLQIFCCMLILSVFPGVANSGEHTLTVPENVLAVQSELPEIVDFNFHIKPILSDRCFKCHGPDENQRMVNLRLDQEESAYGPLFLGEGAAIVPGQPEDSILLHRVLSSDTDRMMPPAGSGLELNAREKGLLLKWIKQGGEYKPHWSLIPPAEALANHRLPADVNLDYFIERKLEERGLSFSPEADQEILLRRVTFDLTGLPPSLEEIDEFVHDSSPDALEKVLDRLLRSPHYGERMAANWLDLARYADTYGYQADYYRPMWRWRDWVIQAFNEHKPYDEFVTWQLAGDLLPEPSIEQILATGFNRNHSQNAEGGIINEEFRVEYVADRTNTFGKAFLGFTLECARCHDHKYDPISQKDYYQIFSFFNNVDESGQITWSKPDTPPPSLLLFEETAQQQLAELDCRIAELEKQLQNLPKQKNDEFGAWLERLSHSNAESVFQPKFRSAHFPLDLISKYEIANTVGSATGQIVDNVSLAIADATPEVVEGIRGNATPFDGDMMMDFPGVGRFSRADPFSIGMWVYIPADLKQGVIFHSNRGGIIYCFKGYQVSVEDDRFDIRLAHSFPYASIHLITESLVPKEEWIHLMLTSDGSGKAGGVRFYINGELQDVRVKRDNLYQDIVFVKENIRTNLRVGARWRSKGFTSGRVDEIEVFSQALSPLAVQIVAGKTDPKELAQLNPAECSVQQRELLLEYYIRNFDTDYLCLQEELHDLRRQRCELEENAEEIMVMAEMSEPRQAYVLLRGAYNEYGDAVQPDTPESILPFPADYPRTRLGLARWLMHPENPLTARVVVNRMWQQFFGRGLVETSENFGSQGSIPSHPELLDWLAVQLMESGWNLQALQKQIILSRTYRQTSRITPELLQQDPNNLWLARGPQQRLSAEMLRDNALAASRLLVRKVGGPSVKPYQPEGLWSYATESNYEQDHGENLYRRSLYTFWKRTIPPPAMETFDAPSRSHCTVRRQQTNTPLQALVLLNDPQFIEAARALAVRVMADSGESVKDAITAMFRLLTARRPAQHELTILCELYENQKAEFQDQPELSKGWLSTGEYQHPETCDSAELAAYTVVASTIMNSDACMVKR